ncbi:MAG: ABC transporter permease [Vagococcus sp.]
MRLYKLAVKNVKTQFHHYFMYFVSMAFSVMIYYSFASMSHDKELMKQASNDLRINVGLGMGSTLIFLFIIVFMFSANHFFIKRRKREIGLYSLLGMRKRQIGRMFFAENMLLGSLALLTGIILGTAFSKLFAMVLLKIIKINVETSFIFSWEIVFQTILFFILLLVVVSFRTASVVYKYQLIDLFKANERMEGTQSVTFVTWFFGLIGIVCLLAEWYLATHFMRFIIVLDDVFHAVGIGLVVGPVFILVLGVVGTYLFFSQFLVIALQFIKGRNNYYYHQINMITIGNLNFHLKKNGKTFATISILLGGALSAIGGAASLYSYKTEIIDRNYPASYAVRSVYYDELMATLEEEHIEKESDYKIEFKLVGLKFGYTVNNIYFNDGQFYSVISKSNYEGANKVVKNLSPIELKHRNDVILFGDSNQTYLNGAITFDKKAILGNVGNVHVMDIMDDSLGNGADMRIARKGMIVSDALYQELEGVRECSYHLVNVKESDTNDDLAELMLKKMSPYTKVDDYYIAKTEEENGKMTYKVEDIDGNDVAAIGKGYQSMNFMSGPQGFSDRYSFSKEIRTLIGLLIYVAMFLGLVFMIATGSMITLKQLSEAEDEKYRYSMLKKIGVPKQMIAKSIYKQNFVIFFVPLGVGVWHAVLALEVFFAITSKLNLFFTYVSVLLLILIYVMFYFATSSSYNKIITQSK